MPSRQRMGITASTFLSSTGSSVSGFLGYFLLNRVDLARVVGSMLGAVSVLLMSVGVAGRLSVCS